MNVIKAVVFLQDGRNFHNREFGVHIYEIAQGYIDAHDWKLIHECVAENIDPSQLDHPNEFAYLFTFHEVIDEFEDRFYTVNPEKGVNHMIYR